MKLSNRRVLLIAIIAGGVILNVLFGSGCSSSSNVPNDIRAAAKAGNGRVELAEDHFARTPSGVRVFSKKQLSDSQYRSIDEGLRIAFESARVDGFTQRLDPAFFQVNTPPYPCRPSPLFRTPSFLVRADTYDGTEFDQYNSKGAGRKDDIGVVFAAEMVLSIGTPGSDPESGWMYVCPDEPAVVNAVRHGADHILLANNTSAYEDGNAYFNCSIYHYDQGFGAISHPLLPRAGRCTNAGFRTAPAGRVSFVVEPVK